MAAAHDVVSAISFPANATTVLDKLRAALPAMQHRSVDLDRERAFPFEDIALLRTVGALKVFCRPGIAPLLLMDALRLVGRGNLSLGRIFEGHVNGANLVAWYGDRDQRRRLDDQLEAGEIFGVWNTEQPPGVGMTIVDGETRLIGRKTFATGAGHIDHAIVTAACQDGRRQMIIAAANDLARADISAWKVRGMRATLSGVYDLCGLPVDRETRLGAPDDYATEPRFSAGAWRFAAVQLGGVERIIGLLRNHLATSMAGEDPIHRARFGMALAGARSAWLWVREAAQCAEAQDAGETHIAVVLMTRGVVERAALTAIDAAERTVGTRAFLEGSPLDLACRDLSFYLRQPVPDQALDRASAAFIEQDCWRDDPLW